MRTEGSSSKKETILHLVISCAVFLFFALGPTIALRFKLEDISFLLEGVLAAGLVFLALQLRIAQRFAGTASNAEKVTEAAVNEIKKSVTDMSVTCDNFQKSLCKFEVLSGQREEIIDLGRKALNTVVSVERGIPNVDDITQGLKFNDVNEICARVAKSFQGYADAWSKWSSKTLNKADRSQAYAWCKLIETYHRGQEANLTRGEILTSPGTYTEILFSCCKQLIELQNAEENKITLFLVTSMLPDEFYNWPQGEYTVDTMYPEYIAHTWEGAEKYFMEMRRLKDKVTVRRCLLVKSNGFEFENGFSIPSIRKYEDLARTGELMIHERPLKYDILKDAKVGHMFTHMTKLDYRYEQGKKFLRINQFKFYPVGTKAEFEKSLLEPRRTLLYAFIEDLHSSPDDALFHIVDSPNGPIWKILSEHQELMPELALFKIEGNAAEASPTKWLFGIVGYLYPFTETMRIRFVAGEELSELAELFTDFERGSKLAEIG